MAKRLKRTARGVVTSAVLLSPWLFASAEPWAFLFISLLVSVGVVAWLLSLFGEEQAHVRAGGLTLALTALLFFVFCQLLPLPGSFVRLVSPLSFEVQTKRSQILDEVKAKDFLPDDVTLDRTGATLSSSAASTWRSLYLLTAYISIFLVMANSIKEWGELRQAATALVISGFIMAVFGLLQKFSGTSDIYWFHTPRFGGQIFGPFTNRDHFACHMNMVFGLALGLILAAARAPELQAFTTLREKLVWLSSEKASRIVLLGFAAALMGATVCVTLSRGGITSLAASVGIVGAFVALRSTTPKRGRVIGAVTLLVVAAVVWLGWKPVLERLGTLADIANDPLSDTRFVATLDTLRLFVSCPIVGCGFGSFQYVFPIFQSPSIQIGRFWHTHNDIAQFLAEGGILGAALMALVGFLFIQVIRKRLRDATTAGRLFAGGVAVGIVTALLHSFVDYGLHKPANAFLFAALCGMCVAALHVRHGKQKHKTRVRKTHDINRLSAEQRVVSPTAIP